MSVEERFLFESIMFSLIGGVVVGLIFFYRRNDDE